MEEGRDCLVALDRSEGYIINKLDARRQEGDAGLRREKKENSIPGLKCTHSTRYEDQKRARTTSEQMI